MGNAVTDDYYDYIGTFEYWWTHGLISDSTYKTLRTACLSGSSQHPSIICNTALEAADSEFGNIDPYSIYTRPCKSTASMKRSLNGRYVSDILMHFQLKANVLMSIYVAIKWVLCPHYYHKILGS